MTTSTEYRSIKKIEVQNHSEAVKRIAPRFNGKIPTCEDHFGNPICPAYEMCKQVKTYEPGIIPEPLCALPDDEVRKFAIPITRKVG